MKEKDALKNSILLKFIIDKFKKVLVTFNLTQSRSWNKPWLKSVLSNIRGFWLLDLASQENNALKVFCQSELLSKVHSANTDLCDGAHFSRQQRSKVS